MNPSTDPTSPALGQVLEHGPDETPQDVRRRLDSMSQLLHQAARTVWARADEDGPTSPLHSLGLGIYLAHGQTQLLLPEDPSDAKSDLESYLDSDLEVEVDELDELDERTVVQLLTEVEELSRPLPVWRADQVHGSQLVVDECDLLREAQHLDC